MMMERILLKTIRFDLQVEHPYGMLIKYLKKLRGTKESKNPLAQAAWSFVNDSFYTTLCLQWEPDILAVCMLYLATKIQKVTPELDQLPLHADVPWWKSLVPDVCKEVLDSMLNIFVLAS